MMQQYHKAFSIFFKHNYFPDEKLRSLSVKPTAETSLILRNNGGMVVPFQDGVHVLYDSLCYGSKRLRTDFLESAGYLEFLIMNKDHHFFNYTSDFDTDISGNYFFFTNAGSAEPNNVVLATKETSNETVLLHATEYVGKEDMIPVDLKNINLFSKPFGLIGIHLHGALEENLNISFSTISTYWCYVVATDYLQELVNPAILNKETEELFSGPEPAQLSEDKKVLLFFSRDPIPHRQQMPHTFQLVEEYQPETHYYKVVLPALPGPSPQHISSIKTSKEHQNKKLSFIFI
ncbi:hypothetical protein [Pedobacter nyackensis]|uniref:hypothetical protein n=1 Tax=Pedobacter nyackensis TaxID=475255 RepID=UPI00292FC5CB|nr:hypothetical protein [Pedobacter nyackensis]